MYLVADTVDWLAYLKHGGAETTQPCLLGGAFTFSFTAAKELADRHLSCPLNYTEPERRVMGF